MNWALTIHRKYIDKIISGDKAFEIRTRVPSALKPGDRIFVVQPSTDGDIIISFVVSAIYRYTPWLGWARYWRMLGISLLEYQDYTEFKKYVYFIGIQQVVIMPANANIRDIGIARAPQWFTIVKQKIPDNWYIQGKTQSI